MGLFNVAKKVALLSLATKDSNDVIKYFATGILASDVLKKRGIKRDRC